MELGKKALTMVKISSEEVAANGDVTIRARCFKSRFTSIILTVSHLSYLYPKMAQG